MNDSSLIECQVIDHEPKIVTLCFGYNLVDWYMNNGVVCDSNYITSTNNYTFYACDPGWTAASYQEECQPCNRGTYKPTIGLYECIKCPNNTYGDAEGGTSCKTCPTNSVSIEGSGALDDCTCKIDYYKNPVLGRNDFFFVRHTCIPCPVGSICNSTNTTGPVVAAGYWNSAASPYHFYKCFPQSSCPGGAADTCTPGYSLINCGACSPGYYKWKNSCVVCGQDATFRFLLLIVLVFIVGALFLFFSSIKLSHISSISIAFSYTQIVSLFAKFDVKWPVAMDGAITGAALTSFEISFFSPECLFPTLTYTSKWATTMFLPFYVFVAFLTIYMLGVLRAAITYKIGHKVPFKYWPLIETMEEQVDYEKNEMEEKLLKKQANLKKGLKLKLKSLLTSAWISFKNILIWLRNLGVWIISAKQTKNDMRIFANKIVNGFTSFLSFCFIFIMTQSATPFVCSKQPTGDWTMNASPDIFCFSEDPNWRFMVVLSSIFYTIFALGILIFFLYVYIEKKRIDFKVKKLLNGEITDQTEVAKQLELVEKKQQEHLKSKMEHANNNFVSYGRKLMQWSQRDREIEKRKVQHALDRQREKEVLKSDPSTYLSYRNFNQRFSFILKRFKRKYLWWEVVITGRKLILSILYIFVGPFLVVTLGIGVIFVALILQEKYVPFKAKFLNFFEYVTLLTTLIVLFFGLLFFVEAWPSKELELAGTWIATIIIVSSIVFVFAMIFWDVHTRRKQDKKKSRRRKQKLVEQFGEEQAKKMEKQLKSLFAKTNKTIIEDLDEGNEDDKWVVMENEYAKVMAEELSKYSEDYWYRDDEDEQIISPMLSTPLLAGTDNWNITENTLKKLLSEEENDEEWIIVENPLSEEYQFDYQQLEMKLQNVEFTLPFFQEDDSESSDEDTSRNINEVIENLFSTQRIAKKMFLINRKAMRSVNKAKQVLSKKNKQKDNYDDIKADDEHEQIEDIELYPVNPPSPIIELEYSEVVTTPASQEPQQSPRRHEEVIYLEE